MKTTTESAPIIIEIVESDNTSIFRVNKHNLQPINNSLKDIASAETNEKSIIKNIIPLETLESSRTSVIHL